MENVQSALTLKCKQTKVRCQRQVGDRKRGVKLFEMTANNFTLRNIFVTYLFAHPMQCISYVASNNFWYWTSFILVLVVIVVSILVSASLFEFLWVKNRANSCCLHIKCNSNGLFLSIKPF